MEPEGDLLWGVNCLAYACARGTIDPAPNASTSKQGRDWNIYRDKKYALDAKIDELFRRASVCRSELDNIKKNIRMTNRRKRNRKWLEKWMGSKQLSCHTE